MTRHHRSTPLTGTQYWRRVLGTLFLIFLIAAVIAGTISASTVASNCIFDLLRLQFSLPSCMGKIAVAWVLYLIFKWGSIALLVGIVITYVIDLGRWGFRRYRDGDDNGDTNGNGDRGKGFTKAPF
jgi:hypothetical protein